MKIKSSDSTIDTDQPENEVVNHDVVNAPDREKGFVDKVLSFLTDFRMEIRDVLDPGSPFDDGNNRRRGVKKLGIFTAIERALPPWAFDLLKKDWPEASNKKPALELTIKTQIGEVDRIGSLVRLYQYLEAHSSGNKPFAYIYAISYLAETSKKYGFRTVDIPPQFQCNTDSAVLLDKFQTSDRPAEKRMAQAFSYDDIKIIYLPVSEFMEKISQHPDFERTYGRVKNGMD